MDGLSLRVELQQVPPEKPKVQSLYITVEWMRYCDVCNSEQRFVANTRCDAGLIARCVNCGDLRLAPVTHTDAEWESYT